MNILLTTRRVVTGVAVSLLLVCAAHAESALSPDGKTFLCSQGNGEIRLRDTATGKTISVFKGHTGAVTALNFSPDDQTFLSGGEDGTVRLWSLTKEQMLWGSNLEGDATYPNYPQYGNDVQYVAFLPDGKNIITAQKDGSIKILEKQSGKEVRAFRKVNSLLWSARLSPDGMRVVSTSAEKNVWTIHVWDVAAGEEVKRFTDTSTSVYAAFLDDGKTLLSGGNNSLRLWDVASGRLIRTLQNPTLIDSIALSPDAKTVLVGAAYRGGGVITAWDTGTGRITNRLRGHAGEVTELSFSPDSMMALSASDDGTLIIWDVSKGVIIGKWKDE